MTTFLIFGVGCAVGSIVTALVIWRKYRMPETVAQKFTCGFSEEWDDFEKRHRLFLERFPNLVTALNTAFIRRATLSEHIDKFVFYYGRLCCEDFFEIGLCCGNGYGAAALKLVRSLYERAVTLRPKTRGHLRGLLHTLWDYAMWSGAVPVQANPIALVTVKGCSKRTRQPRSLNVDQFQRLGAHLREPFKTMALLSVWLGLRVSELLALRWRDVDWLTGTLNVERGIVNQIVDDVKTDGSRRLMTLDHELIAILETWRQNSQFQADGDWIFPSPLKLGRLPYSYTGFWRELQRAGADSGIGPLGTHAFRHTYRSWLDAVGTPIAVQQKLMRHSDIRTTMNIYGSVVTNEMEEAGSRVVGLALRPVN